MTAATVRLALNLSQSILSCCLAFWSSAAARPIAKVAAAGSTRGADAVDAADDDAEDEEGVYSDENDMDSQFTKDNWKQDSFRGKGNGTDHKDNPDQQKSVEECADSN